MSAVTRAAWLVLGTALLAAPAAAQAPPPQPPPAPAPDSAPAGEDEALVNQALDRLAAGEAAAAVELLEPVKRRPDPPPQLLALLGVAYLEAGQPGAALEILAPLTQNGGGTVRVDPAVLYNAGRAALAAGEPARAEEYLQRSVDLQPGTPATRELGLLLGSQGRMAEAFGLLVPWAQRHPDDTEVRLAGALAAVRLGRIPAAENLLEDMPLESDRVRLLRGQLLSMQGDPDGALAMLAPILEPPEGEVDMDARRAMAEAHLSLGSSDRAIEILEGRTEGDAAATLLLGKAQYRSGDIQSAMATLETFAPRLLAAAQTAGEGMANRELAVAYALEYGRVLATAGRQRDALPHLQVATRLSPESKEAWQALGQTLSALDRRDEATEALQRFQELARAEGSATEQRDRADRDAEDPTGREVRRAQELLAEERYDQALRVLRQEAALSPEDPRPRLFETHVLIMAGRLEEALTQARDTVRRFPENADAYYQRAVVELAREDREAAETDFRQALALAPDHVPAMSDLAVLLTVQGQRAEAERLLERVLELRPEDERARENLERLRQGKSS